MDRGGDDIVHLVNMDEKEIEVFKQVGPIVSDVNELLKRVKRLDQIDASGGKEILFIIIIIIIINE